MTQTFEPNVIREVRFDRDRNGYRSRDVDDFLSHVADTIEDLRDQTNTLHVELERASSTNEATHLIEMAQQVADELVDEANRRVIRVFEAAQHVADDLVDEAKHRIGTAVGEVTAAITGAAHGVTLAISACDDSLSRVDELRQQLFFERRRLEELAGIIDRTAESVAGADRCAAELPRSLNSKMTKSSANDYPAISTAD